VGPLPVEQNVLGILRIRRSLCLLAADCVGRLADRCYAANSAFRLYLILLRFLDILGSRVGRSLAKRRPLQGGYRLRPKSGKIGRRLSRGKCRFPPNKRWGCHVHWSDHGKFGATKLACNAGGSSLAPPGRARAEGEEMNEPLRPKEVGFSSRTIVLIILALIAAAALTIEGTYLILNAFVLHDPSDPLTKAGGLLPEQKGKGK
jgi:hypothetical protein